MHGQQNVKINFTFIRNLRSINQQGLGSIFMFSKPKSMRRSELFVSLWHISAHLIDRIQLVVK